MSWVAVGVAGLQLTKGYFDSQNIKATGELNRDIADMNAEFAELDAHDSKLEGISDIARYQQVIDQTLGTQRANLAAADVDLNYGSAASIQSETEFIGQLNKMEMLKQTEESALGYKRQARQYKMDGALGYNRAIQQSGDAMFAGVIGASGTMLDGYRDNASSNDDDTELVKYGKVKKIKNGVVGAPTSDLSSSSSGYA